MSNTLKKPLLSDQSYYQKKKHQKRFLITAAAVTLFGTSCIYLSRQLPRHDPVAATGFWDKEPHVISPGISFDSFEAGLAKCQWNEERAQQHTNTTRTRTRNPRAVPNTPSILIRNGHVWLGDRYLEKGQVYLENGLIAAVGNDLNVPEGTRIIDAGGRVVTPGIVDMHSHMAVSSLDGLTASDDTNEMTTPATPYVNLFIAFFFFLFLI